MDYSLRTLEEIKQGYFLNKETNCYICNYCGKTFQEGQIFSMEDNFYTAEFAVAKHIKLEHGSNFLQLLNADTKYNTLTDTQKELLLLFQSELSDNEIAAQTGVTSSTVRRQRFTFREKAKQAKLYLAVYEHVFHDRITSAEDIIPIHNW